MMSRRLALLICILLIASGFAFAQSGVASHPIATNGAQYNSAPAIVVGPGDTLDVKVFNVDALSGSFRVSQKGKIDLPLIGKTLVSGLTADEVAAKIQSKLKNGGYVLQPQVTVLIAEYATQGVNVMGEVLRPGIYPTLGSRRLLDILTLAGGVSPSAGKLVTIIHRNDPHHPVYLALAQNAAGLKLQANPVIQPGDTIIVQKSGIIYILGDVNRPGGYLIDNNEQLTLMQALSLAGGSTITSKIKDVHLIRKLPVGREEIKLNLKKIYLGKEADINVADGDILYIPSSGIKTFIFKGYSGLSGTISTAAITTGR